MILVDYPAQHYPGRIAPIPTDLDAVRAARLCDRFYDLYLHKHVLKEAEPYFRFFPEES